uniref:Uncharacterized protein n=1 Tax=Arundo donax TaxID=35708 RepID=A0A0A9EC16_ARUDO
MGGRRRRGKP